MRENADPPATLHISHDLRWSLTADPADRGSLRLAQYQSNAPDPEGSIELTAGDLPLIRDWLRGVLRAAEWPSDREFAGTGILQMIPQPRPELYLERLSPGRGRFGPGYSVARDGSDYPDAYQRLCLYEPDIRLIVNWMSAWSEKLHGEDDRNWLVEERSPRTAEERAADDDDWDDIDATPEVAAPAPINPAEGSPALARAEFPSLAEDEEVSAEFEPEISEARSEHGPRDDLRYYLDASRGEPLSNTVGPGRVTPKPHSETIGRARQSRRQRWKNDAVILAYVFGLPLLAFWLWELAKRVFRGFF